MISGYINLPKEFYDNSDVYRYDLDTVELSYTETDSNVVEKYLQFFSVANNKLVAMEQHIIHLPENSALVIASQIASCYVSDDYKTASLLLSGALPSGNGLFSINLAYNDLNNSIEITIVLGES